MSLFVLEIAANEFLPAAGLLNFVSIFLLSNVKLSRLLGRIEKQNAIIQTQRGDTKWSRMKQKNKQTVIVKAKAKSNKNNGISLFYVP